MPNLVRPILAVILTTILAGAALPAGASEMMPNFGDIPSGWTVDRYDPAGFADVGAYAGRYGVLGIGITSAGSVAGRGAAYAASYYNTQGRAHALDGGAGSALTADLYIPSSWADAANGARRTDMWGVMSDGTTIVDYPIIGFTNVGGARFRIWEEDLNAWIDVASPVQYDAWNTLRIVFTGDSYDYSVNWQTAYVDNTVRGATTLTQVIMQAYNFGDPAIAPAVVNDYTAYWSVPEPVTAAILLTGALGMGLARRRRRR